MTEPQRQAISLPVAHLRLALGNEQYGAAKDLAEAACRVCIDQAGASVAPSTPLPALFKETLRASGLDASRGDLGRSLAATVQRLAELRNAAGVGHGRAAQPDRSSTRLAQVLSSRAREPERPQPST